jgi:hypothetical protein
LRECPPFSAIPRHFPQTLTNSRFSQTAFRSTPAKNSKYQQEKRPSKDQTHTLKRRVPLTAPNEKNIKTNDKKTLQRNTAKRPLIFRLTGVREGCKMVTKDVKYYIK